MTDLKSRLVEALNFHARNISTDCNDYCPPEAGGDCLTYEEAMKLRALASELAEAEVVPKSALAWLFGEEGEFEPGPDAYFTFGGKLRLKEYWWRSRFRAMLKEAK